MNDRESAEVAASLANFYRVVWWVEVGKGCWVVLSCFSSGLFALGFLVTATLLCSKVTS